MMYSIYLTAVLTIICAVLLYLYVTKSLSYWSKKNIPYVQPHWFFGSFRDVVLGECSWASFTAGIYNKFKGNSVVGMLLLHRPGLLILDPQLVERILVQDFAHFHDRATPRNPRQQLGSLLYSATGLRWRALRYRLMPSFTTAKVRGMCDQMCKCGEWVLCRINQHVEDNVDVDVEQLMFSFVTEVIAGCTFGIKVKSNPTLWPEFVNAVADITLITPFRVVKNMLTFSYPGIVSFFNVRTNPKISARFFVELTKSTMEYRERNNVQRNDFLQMMLKLKEIEESGKTSLRFVSDKYELLDDHRTVDDKDHLPERIFTDDCIASVLYSFAGNGIIPTAQTITFALFEIAQHPDVQRDLQKEIDSSILKNNKLNYESIKDMVFLDQIIQETQRLYTSSPILTREVTKTYVIPGTEIVLYPGMFVIIPFAAIHRDPSYYPSPDSFDPGRFKDNNFRPNPVFIPFGQGPRICIAAKFAVVMIKICLAKILSKYSVQLSDKMHLPLQFDENDFSLRSKGGVRMKFSKRQLQ